MTLLDKAATLLKLHTGPELVVDLSVDLMAGGPLSEWIRPLN